MVPVFVGSNPITHPIKKRVAFATLFFIWAFVGDGIRKAGRAGTIDAWDTVKSQFLEQLPIVFVGANCVRLLLGPGVFLLRAITDRPYNVV